MAELIPGDWVVQGGAVGLLTIVALMIFTGRLVPRRLYEDMEKDRDQWREVALKAIGHADQLLPGAEIATEVARALSAATTPPRTDSNAAAAWQALGGAVRGDGGS